MKSLKFRSDFLPKIADGTKFHTRRTLEPQPPDNTDHFHFLGSSDAPESIRESFKKRGIENTFCFFVAEGGDLWPCSDEQKYSSPVGLPGEHFAVTDERGIFYCEARVKALRIEQLSRITREDSVAEGIDFTPCDQTIAFRDYSKPDGWIAE